MYSRRQRTSNRKYGKSEEEFNEVRGKDWPHKSRQKKRKISDLLGPPWSEEDLKHFYQSYRRHGKDWKKVAASFRNRTVEMIEVLYRMNKAYLSLPEGAASSEGLIAMMTDHYNILDESKGNDEDESSKEIAGPDPSTQISSRSQRNKSAVMQPGNNSKVASQLSAGMMSDGVPSPAKKPRTIAVNRPRTVGKRTPRFPSMQFQDKKPSGKSAEAKPMDNDAGQGSYGECDEMKVALALAASASERVASPQISRTQGSRAVRLRNSAGHVQNGNTKNMVTAESESSANKLNGWNMEDREDEASEESRDTENGVVTKSLTNIVDARRRVTDVGESRDRPRTPKVQSRKGKVESFWSNDLKEECSCTEEETLKKEDVKGEPYSKKKKLPSSQTTKKRNRQLFTGDEKSGLDALATLADLSLNGLLPSPRRVSEGEELAAQLEALCGPSKEVSSMMTAKAGLVSRSKELFSQLDCGSNFDVEFQKASDLKRRKRTVVLDKRSLFPDGNGEADDKASKLPSEEHVAHFPVQIPSKYAGTHVKKEVTQEPRTQEVMIRESEAEGLNIVNLIPLKQRRQRKTKLSKERARTLIVSATVAEDNSTDNVRLIHCLSSQKARKWCIYEWFYSAIDLPWFLKNEFVEYLDHAGLGHVSRLTRDEWGVIRGSLGKPRRLSKRFLQEEREKLESYRDSVRMHHRDVRNRNDLSAELPSSLVVGQRVIARHPKNKELYNGSILTVDSNKFRIQFDRPEMGVELVADIDCMPINGLEKNRSIGKSIIANVGNQNIENSIETATAPAAPRPQTNRDDKPEAVLGSSSTASQLNALCKQAQVADTLNSVCQVKRAVSKATNAAKDAEHFRTCSLAQVQAVKADIRALDNLYRVLEKKVFLVSELESLHCHVLGNQSEGGDAGIDDTFKELYGSCILQLKEVNEELQATETPTAFAAPRSQTNRHDNPEGVLGSNSATSLLNALYKEAQAADTMDSVLQVLVAAVKALEAAQDATDHPSCPFAQIEPQEDYIRALGYLIRALKNKESILRESCYINDGASLISKLEEVNEEVNVGRLRLRQQNKHEYIRLPPWRHPSSQQIKALWQEPFPRAVEVMAKARQQASVIVSTAMNTLASIKAGEDALAKIGMALKQLPSSSFYANGVAGDSPRNYRFLGVQLEPMIACISFLLMVQAFTEHQFPPAEIGMAFETILRALHPYSSQSNYLIYQEIKDYASLLKNQILQLIPTQSLPVDVPLPY